MTKPASAPRVTEPLPGLQERLDGLEAVLFDLDGTLIDTVELIRVSFRYATEKVLGEAIPDEITMANVGQPLATPFRHIAPEPAAGPPTVVRGFHIEAHDRLAKSYPGTVETLTAIAARGTVMGVVTSKGTQAAMRGLELFGLTDYFKVIVTADDVTKHKPDPYPLRFAADALDVALEYCVYVGDSPHDMQSAISGNAISVAALWGAFRADEVLAPGPAYALSSIEELPALLGGDAGRFAV